MTAACHTLLEVCCADTDSAAAAIEGGAHRIELCSALEAGGLTPSAGLIATARRLTADAGVKLHILIRPRPGDYIYSPVDIDAMLADIAMARFLGADGVVIGALRPDGTVDTEATARMAGAAAGMAVTFHRAFDLCRDPLEALDVIAATGGVTRILTSGQAPSAPAGAAMIARLVEAAPEGLTILAGAGVTSANAAALVAATGVSEIHASAKCAVKSAMTFRRDGVAMGSGSADEYTRLATSAAEVRAIIDSLS